MIRGTGISSGPCGGRGSHEVFKELLRLLPDEVREDLRFSSFSRFQPAPQ
jgi:hypothetical protein